MKLSKTQDVPGFSGYFVDENGFVYSQRRKKLITLAQEKTRLGYMRIGLWDGEKRFRKLVHRVVAETFLHRPEWATEVNHKNGVKSDNRVSNLEWSNRSMNIKHAFSIGLCKPNNGEKCRAAKLTENDVMEIRKSLKEPYRGILLFLGKKYGVTPEAIAAIRDRKNWKHLGHNGAKVEAWANTHGAFLPE